MSQRFNHVDQELCCSFGIFQSMVMAKMNSETVRKGIKSIVDNVLEQLLADFI